MKEKIKKSVLLIIPKAFKTLLRKLKLGYTLVSSEKSYLVQTGFVNSLLSNSLTNINGNYIPWMNYPVIEFLKDRLHKKMVIFEYGSGFSTAFFAKRCEKITSVEYDFEWYNKTKNIILKGIDNGKVNYAKLNELYPYSIEKFMGNNNCDIIIIDGRKRVESAKIAYNHLSESGVLIFDDTHREYYQEGITFYKEKGFNSLTFKGLKPTSIATNQTTILYRKNNCLGI